MYEMYFMSLSGYLYFFYGRFMYVKWYVYWKNEMYLYVDWYTLILFTIHTEIGCLEIIPVWNSMKELKYGFFEATWIYWVTV